MPRKSSESEGVSRDVPRNDSEDQPRGNLLWGGRFSAKPDALMQAINVSIGFDRRLAVEDLAGSRAHVAMLARQRDHLGRRTRRRSSAASTTIEAEIAAGTFPFREEFEDIHLNVEERLDELIGPAAGRLHTARSRNDQVALDFRLWVRAACDRTVEQVLGPAARAAGPGRGARRRR